jgi:hypothetical protein
MNISCQLHDYVDYSSVVRKQLTTFKEENPFNRIKREIKDELEREDAYRISILKNVATFGKFETLFANSCIIDFCYHY